MDTGMYLECNQSKNVGEKTANGLGIPVCETPLHDIQCKLLELEILAVAHSKK